MILNITMDESDEANNNQHNFIDIENQDESHCKELVDDIMSIIPMNQSVEYYLGITSILEILSTKNLKKEEHNYLKEAISHISNNLSSVKNKLVIEEFSIEIISIEKEENKHITKSLTNSPDKREDIKKTLDASTSVDLVELSSYNIKVESNVCELFFEPSDLELKLKNEVYEKEINLLKSLILINNLHLNSIEDNRDLASSNLKTKDNYFLSMIEGKSEAISENTNLYNNIQTLNLLTVQIANLGQELKELKESIENQRFEFKKQMYETHQRVLAACNQEVKNRNRIKGKMKEIEKLI